MLTFFRKIRKSLTFSGATGKYIVYALGEIALVVVGILFALQINNWNNERIDRKSEKEILARIINDLSIDLETIARANNSNEVRLLRGVWIIEQLGKDMTRVKQWESYQRALRNHDIERLWDDPFGSTLVRIRFYFLFEESKVTIQEIMSTGKLGIIKNDEIRIAIQSHYAEVSKLKALQNLLLYNREKFVEYLLEHQISLLNQMNKEEVVSKIGNPEHLIAYIENFLDISNVTFRNQTIEENSIKNQTESLLAKIENYLGDLQNY